MAADFEGYLADELGQRIALLEETAFAVGDGSGKPLGVSTSGNGVSTVTAATGSSTGFKLADVNAVWAALPDGYKPNASWIMSPSAFRSLAVLADTAGGLVLRLCTPLSRRCSRGRCTSRRTFGSGCERTLGRGRRLLDRLPSAPCPGRRGPATRGDFFKHRPARLSRLRAGRRSCDRRRCAAHPRQQRYMSRLVDRGAGDGLHPASAMASACAVSGDRHHTAARRRVRLPGRKRVPPSMRSQRSWARAHACMRAFCLGRCHPRSPAKQGGLPLKPYACRC